MNKYKSLPIQLLVPGRSLPRQLMDRSLPHFHWQRMCRIQHQDTIPRKSLNPPEHKDKHLLLERSLSIVLGQLQTVTSEHLNIVDHFLVDSQVASVLVLIPFLGGISEDGI